VETTTIGKKKRNQRREQLKPSKPRTFHLSIYLISFFFGTSFFCFVCHSFWFQLQHQHDTFPQKKNMDKMKEGLTRAKTFSSAVRRNFPSMAASESTPNLLGETKSRSKTAGFTSSVFSGSEPLVSNRGEKSNSAEAAALMAEMTDGMRFLIEDDADLLSIALKKKLSEASPTNSSEDSSFSAGALLKNHANGFPLFYEFMETSYAEEHLNFLADVGRFKRQMIEQAELIFNKYFNKNSELNCDDFTKQEISQEIRSHSVNVNLFSRASAEILRLVVDIYFPRFTSTEQYQQWRSKYYNDEEERQRRK